jgi:hypothetical protein
MSLPPEVGGVCQPYSMLPLLARTGHDVKYASPALGTFIAVDRSDFNNPRNGGVSLPIRMCLIAPTYMQRAAQAAGIRSMVMIRPRGIEIVEGAGSKPIALSTKLSDIIEGLDS